jgi:hypothetical protein
VRKFCTAGIGTRADIVIDRLKGPLFDPAATSAPADAPPSPLVECMEVQYQYDYLHPCSIFTIRAISVLLPRCPFTDARPSPATRNDAPYGAVLNC